MDSDFYDLPVRRHYCKDGFRARTTRICPLRCIGLFFSVVSPAGYHVRFRILYTKMLKACGRLSQKMATTFDCILSDCHRDPCWVRDKWNCSCISQTIRTFWRLPQSRRHYWELSSVSDVHFVYNHRKENLGVCKDARPRNDGAGKRLSEAKSRVGSAYEGESAAADVDYLLPARLREFV